MAENEAPEKDFDEPHRWEVEPHPWDSSYDLFVTDDDSAALQGILHAAEMYLWDGNNGEERTLRVKMNREIPHAGSNLAAPDAQENEVTVHWGYLVADICNLAKPNSPQRERAALLKQSLQRIARLKQLTVSDAIRQAQRETEKQ